jgi:hypothetical protein
LDEEAERISESTVDRASHLHPRNYSQLDVSARREFAKDLFVELKYYESRDTKPPSDSASTSDRGVVFSIGWSK